jgi:hypothetical protein
MWPSAKSNLEFKVTAPDDVDLLYTLRYLYPDLVTTKRGDELLFVIGNATDSGASSAPVKAEENAQRSGGMVVDGAQIKKEETPDEIKEEEKQGDIKDEEQPHEIKVEEKKPDAKRTRRSSRAKASRGESDSGSAATVTANMEDASQDGNDNKRRRYSSRRKSTTSELGIFCAIINN